MMRLLLAFVFSLPALASAESLWPEPLSCESAGKVRYLHRGEKKSENAAYCFSADHSYFLSVGCKVGRPCQALATKTKVPDSELKGALGSPGFKLCRRSGGEPQLLEYQEGEKWWQADRCLFPDGSFVDTGLLIRNRAASATK